MNIAQNDQSEWSSAVLAYAQAINDYVAKGMASDWKKVGKEPPKPKTEHLLPSFRAALLANNQPQTTQAQRENFRRDWPRSHGALTPLLQEVGQIIPEAVLLDNGNILARIGAPHEGGKIILIDGEHIETVEGAVFFGRCPNRRFFALANEDGVRVTDGWQGPEVATFDWPTGLEDLPPNYVGERLDGPPTPTRLIPFPCGTRVLVVSSDGIFVLSAQGARRILTTQPDSIESLTDDEDDDDDDDDDDGNELSGLSMEHGAVSPDGKWIAVGEQCSRHRVVDADLNHVANIGPVGEYPHFTLFSSNSDKLICNACHFYNGATLCVDVKDLPGLDTDYYANDERTPTVHQGARVYAGAHRGDEFIVGDAYGYVRAFSETGEFRWQLFIGSTIGAIDISRDGTTMIVTTCAGFITVVQLDAGQMEPWQIGVSSHRELRTWLFWKDQEQALLW